MLRQGLKAFARGTSRQFLESLGLVLTVSRLTLSCRGPELHVSASDYVPCGLHPKLPRGESVRTTVTIYTRI